MSNATQRLKEELTSGRIAEIYAKTYYSLFDRVEVDGFYPESVGDHGYGNSAAEYFRTVGAAHTLFNKTGEYEVCERIIRFALASAKRAGINRIPHTAHKTAGEDGNAAYIFDVCDQLDGTFHVID
jgi:hypothetical protein